MKSARLARDGYLLASVLALALSTPAFAQVGDADVAADSSAESAAENEKPETAPTQPKPALPAVDPELVRLHMTDGAVITGKLSISEITIETDFGPLTIPITKIRTFTPGLNSHTELSEKVDGLISDLSGDDEKRRQTAQRELVGMGLPVRRRLEQHRDSADAEAAKQIRAVLDQLEELAEAAAEGFLESDDEQWILEDSVETTGFTVVGEIFPRSFDLTNRYGTLAIEIGDVKSGRRRFAEVAEDVRRSFSVDGSFLAQLRFKTSGIRVERGDRVTVSAEGRISRAGSTSYASGPDGSSRFGTYSQNPRIPGGALVARIGSGGKVIKVGSKTTFACTRPGTLKFAIGMRHDYVGRYQFVGQYNLKIHVARGR